MGLKSNRRAVGHCQHEYQLLYFGDVLSYWSILCFISIMTEEDYCSLPSLAACTALSGTTELGYEEETFGLDPA